MLLRLLDDQDSTHTVHKAEVHHVWCSNVRVGLCSLCIRGPNPLPRLIRLLSHLTRLQRRLQCCGPTIPSRNCVSPHVASAVSAATSPAFQKCSQLSLIQGETQLHNELRLHVPFPARPFQQQHCQQPQAGPAWHTTESGSASSQSMRRHLFVTGQPGAGKSTLIQRVLQQLQLPAHSATGFYTEEVRSGGERQGFDVVTLDGQRSVLSRAGTARKVWSAAGDRMS